MNTLPRVRSKATNPSSHAAMAPSLLSRSLSQEKGCSYSSTAAVDVATALGGEEGLHQSRNMDQHYDKKQAQAIASIE
jgi:hypothetical protein